MAKVKLDWIFSSMFSMFLSFLIFTFLTFYSQDNDSFLTTAELATVLRLFLPLQFGQEDQFVDSLVKKMDGNSDGKIGLETFVQGVKQSGD